MAFYRFAVAGRMKFVMFWTVLLRNLKRAKLRRQFQRQRSALEESFTCQVSQRNDPEGVIWHDFQWLSDPILFIRDDNLEPHHAFVGIAAIFTSPPGMVQTQAGTAVFHYEAGAWKTEGRLLLNITPSEAMEHVANRSATLR
jgi:hypothetical protein